MEYVYVAFAFGSIILLTWARLFQEPVRSFPMPWKVRGKTHILAHILAHGALVGQLAENGIHVVLISDRESQHEGPTGLWREREMS